METEMPVSQRALLSFSLESLEATFANSRIVTDSFRILQPVSKESAFDIRFIWTIWES
jgi:hypothetical protein